MANRAVREVPNTPASSGLRIETRPVPTLGLVLPTDDGEAFVDWATIEDLSQITRDDLVYGIVSQGPYVAPDASKALVAAGLAGLATRDRLYGTDALRDLVQRA